MRINALEFLWNVRAGKDYVPELPKGWKVLGVVTSFGNRKSALFVSDKGTYYRANGSVYKELNQDTMKYVMQNKENGVLTTMINLDALYCASMRRKKQE